MIYNNTIKDPKVSNALLSKLVYVVYSSDPAAEFEKLTDEEKELVRQKVLSFCLDALTVNSDFQYGVLSLTNNAIWILISKIVIKKYAYKHDPDILYELTSHSFNCVLNLLKKGIEQVGFDPKMGNFSSYISPVVSGAAADRYQQINSAVSFPTSALRTAKQARDEYIDFFGGELPKSIDTIVIEYWKIDPVEDPKRFAKKVRSVRKELNFFNSPISIYTEALNGDGDTIIDFIEGDSPNPLDSLLLQELGDYVKTIVKRHGKVKARTYFKLKLRKKTTDYTIEQAMEDTGLNKNRLYKLIAELDSELRDLILGDVKDDEN